MKILSYILAICVCLGFAAEPAYIKAIEESERTGKPILIEFYAKWCPPCLEMEKKVFKDPAVKKELSNFHFLRIDTDKNEPFFCEGQTLRTSDCIKLWDVDGLPAFGIMDINGSLKYLTVGSFEKSTFLVFLKAVRAK